MTARVCALVGATAVGKTDVAVEVAEAADAEIVSIDSMQIYRGMDVGTAKPDARLRRRVPHHLIDVRDPSEPVTVSEFQAMARAAIADVWERGRLPLLVGGSGLYFRAVVDDLRFPPTSSETRARLEAEAETEGAEALHARLEELDPVAAARIEPSNVRRVVRALEVVEITGHRFSDYAGAWDRYESIYELRVTGLERPRAELYARIERRVDAMLARGLVDEARRLEQAGIGTTARQALGYRQVLEAPPGASPDEVRDAITRATKRFARRQESWFRLDPRIRWLFAGDEDVRGRVVQ